MSNLETSDASSDALNTIKLRQETALYIHNMTTDLCAMALRADMDFLAYLLDMARIEAYDRSREEVSDNKALNG